MSERTHSTASSQTSASKSVANPSRKSTPWATIIGGTIIAIAGTAVLIQFFRAEPAAATNGEAGSAKLTPDSPPLARVNGQVISYDIVARECFERIGDEVLENLVNRTIILQEVERRGETVTAAEINAEVSKIAERFNLPVESWYQMLQSERNLSPMQYQRDVIWPMIALRKLAGDEIQITENDMQKAFQRDYGPRVRCRMIMLDNIRRANDVWAKATQAPDDFDKLAREHSIEKSSRSLGGAIPPISRFSGNQSLEDAAFRLKPGEISGLIQVEDRFVILKCEGHTDQVVTDIKDVWNELYAQLTEEKTQERVAAVFENLKKNTRIDNYMTRTTTQNGNRTVSDNSYPTQIQQTGATNPAGNAAPGQTTVR